MRQRHGDEDGGRPAPARPAARAPREARPKAAQSPRDARLKAALKANMARRKAQARERAARDGREDAS